MRGLGPQLLGELALLPVVRAAFPRLHAAMQAALQHWASTQLHTGTLLSASAAARLPQLLRQRCCPPGTHAHHHLPATRPLPSCALTALLPALNTACMHACPAAEKAYQRVRPGGGGVLSLAGLSAFTSDGRKTRSQVVVVGGGRRRGGS